MRRNSLTTEIVAGIAGGGRLPTGEAVFIRDKESTIFPFFSNAVRGRSSENITRTAKCDAASAKRAAKKRRKAKAKGKKR